ncbi:hypothetical protein ACOMHN_026734 [Nucella lapillus]
MDFDQMGFGLVSEEILREVCQSLIPCRLASMYCYNHDRCQSTDSPADTGVRWSSPPEPLVLDTGFRLTSAFFNPKARLRRHYLRHTTSHDLWFQTPFLSVMWRYFFGLAPYFDIGD